MYDNSTIFNTNFSTRARSRHNQFRGEQQPWDVFSSPDTPSDSDSQSTNDTISGSTGRRLDGVALFEKRRQQNDVRVEVSMLQPSRIVSANISGTSVR